MFGRDGDDPPTAAAPAGTATATADPVATAANDIVLTAPAGSRAAGIMRLVTAGDGSVHFALAAERLAANTGKDSYAIWFARPGWTPRRLGFARTWARTQR